MSLWDESVHAPRVRELLTQLTETSSRALVHAEAGRTREAWAALLSLITTVQDLKDALRLRAFFGE